MAANYLSSEVPRPVGDGTNVCNGIVGASVYPITQGDPNSG